jgi:hypothetical protein
MAITKADVNSVYTRYLGRNPDDLDYENLIGQDIEKPKLIEQVRSSDEYKSLTPEDHINRQFQMALGREASDTERERILGNDLYYDFAPMMMGSRERAERTGFKSDLLANDLAKLPEADLVRVYRNYLGRMPDEEAYRNYLRQFEAEPNKGPDIMGSQIRREQKLVDVNYDYAMPEKRLEEVGWSPEAQEYINNKFDAEARRYAAEKGIELPEDFSALAQLRNPYQDNRAGMEGLNMMTPTLYDEGPFGRGETPTGYDIYSESDLYDIPVHAMWYSRAGTAAFLNPEKASQMVQQWGPEASVDAYAKDPGSFMKEAASGVYVNNWLEQNIDPGVTAEGKNKDKLASLAQRYQDISNRAIGLGADPNDIAKYTSDRTSKVAADYQTYYNHTHDNGFLQFLLAAGGLMIGAYGLSKLAGAAGSTAGSVAGTGLKIGAGQGLAPGIGSTIGAGATPIGAGSVGLTAGAGTGLAPGIGATLGAGAGTIGAGAIGLQAPAGAITPTFGVPGYVGTNVPTDIFSKPTFPGGAGGSGTTTTTLPSWSTEGAFKTPTMPGGGGGGPTATTGPSAIDNAISAGKTAYDKVVSPLNKISNLTQTLTGQPTQPFQQAQQGRARGALSAAELYPQSNIMIPIEKYLELTTPRRTFVGGLSAMRNLG